MDIGKELEAIRKLVEDVSGQINVLLLSRAFLMLTLTILLIRALVLWNAGPVQSKVDEVASLAAGFSKDVSIPRVDPVTLLSPPSTMTVTGDMSADLQKDAHQIDEDAVFLRDQYWSIFGIELSLLGTRIQADLRVLMMLLPVFGPLANVYLTSLREKRRHLLVIGNATIREAKDPAEVSSIDKIVFRGSSVPWIFEHPASILNLAFWISVLTIAAVCLVFESYQTRAEDRYVGIILFNLTAAAFLAALHWGRNIEGRMRCQVLEETGFVVPAGPFYARVDRVRGFILTRAARLRARPSILTGAVLMLATLALNIGQTGCDNTPEKGLSIVRMKADYAFNLGVPADSAPSIGGAAYILMLCFALVAVVIVITVSFRARQNPSPRTAKVFCGAAPFVMMLVLAINASTYLLVFFAWMIYWGCASLRYGWLLRQLARGRRTVEEVESTVLSCSEPLLLPVAFCLALSGARYPGLPVMTAGVILLTAGAYAWARPYWIPPERSLIQAEGLDACPTPEALPVVVRLASG